MAKKDSVDLAVLSQKLDDLKELVKDHIVKEQEILKMVPVHEERLSWLKKSVIAIYSIIGTAIVGSVVNAISR